jgi:hypothetical protein
MAYNLKSISSKMGKFFDLVIKYSGDVVKFEKDAKEAAKKMEEASLKAQFARKNMFNVKEVFIYSLKTSEKARFIAKAGIVENRPCGGMGCSTSSSNPDLFGYPDKVFPEEVENIKDFMRDAFTTNLNGYTDEDGNTPNIDRETDGIIRVQPISDDYSSSGNSNEIDQLRNFRSEGNNERIDATNQGNNNSQEGIGSLNKYQNIQQQKEKLSRGQSLSNNQEANTDEKNSHNIRRLRRLR